MAELPHAGTPRREALVPTDLVAGLLIEQASAPSPTAEEPDKLPLKIFGVMAATTLLTFTALTAGYQMLFSHQLFA
jgi:hypothetical protein